MDFSADLDIYFADWGGPALIGMDEVTVVCDAPFRLAEAYEGQVETSAPACSMLDADIVRLAVQHGTQISILPGASLVGDFEVIGVEPDGLGLTRLILTRDS